MKLVLLTTVGSKEPFAEAATEVFKKKIAAFLPFEVIAVKAKSADRGDAAFKKESESKRILEELGPGDEVWLFDEKGRTPKDSRDFSSWLVKGLETGKRRLVVVIGGAYGVSDELRDRAQRVISLSGMTFNHHVAKVVVMEQMYRALCIARNIPYHND